MVFIIILSFIFCGAIGCCNIILCKFVLFELFVLFVLSIVFGLSSLLAMFGLNFSFCMRLCFDFDLNLNWIVISFYDLKSFITFNPLPTDIVFVFVFVCACVWVVVWLFNSINYIGFIAIIIPNYNTTLIIIFIVCRC